MVSLLKSEQARCLRLQKRRKGLEADLGRVKEEADKKLADERLKFDGEIAGIRGERDAFCQRVEMLENELQKVTDQFTGIQSERDTMKTAYSSLERANIDLTENLREVGIARDKVSELLSITTKENEILKSSLAAIPSREAIIAEYQAGDEYKRDIIDARVAAVDTYKCSEEFEEEIKIAEKRGVMEFKGSVNYATELAAVRDAAVSEYRKSTAFTDAVGAEAGKLSMRIVGCCREFLKDDMQRPTREFGEFFVGFVRRQRDGSSSALSGGAHSSVSR